MRIALVVADFNGEVTEPMADKAKERAKELDVEVADELHVYGSFDTPLPAKRLLERDDVDGVVVVGAVIKGETLHDEMIFQATVTTLQRLALEHDKPVALAITGPGMTWEEAMERVDYAANAVDAIVKLGKALE